MGRRFFYGWVVVAVTAVVVVVVSGVRSAPGAFLLSMTQEPGWSTAAGWIAIIAGFAALAIRRVQPDSGDDPGLPTRAIEAGA